MGHRRWDLQCLEQCWEIQASQWVRPWLEHLWWVLQWLEKHLEIQA